MVQEHFIDISKDSNTEAVLTSLPGSIAVVGNAIPKSNYGRIIDDFDIVIRFNHFVIDGYELAIGTKTSLWCTFGDHGANFIPYHTAISPFRIDSAETKKTDIKMIYSEADVHKIMAISRPTTGGALLSLFHFLKIPVIVFNFDFLKSSHYFDVDMDMGLHGIHTPEIKLEEKFIINSEYIRIIA